MEKLVSYVKSNTILFSAILAVLGVFELNRGLLQEALGEWYGGVYICIAIITAFLRVVTVAPPSDK